MEIQLTPRLKKIANQVSPGNKVADIGTDHGYIPIYLAQKKISDFVIASDVNEGPIRSANSNIKKYKCDQKIITRLGSGMQTIKPKEVDTVIIAGMGGILITEILEASIQVTKSIKAFILQPMQAQSILRKYLVKNNFKIEKDLLVKEEHKIYEIIVAKEGKQDIDHEIYFDIGFHIQTNPKELALEFINQKITKESRIIEQIKSADKETTEEIYKVSLEKIKALKEVLACLQ